jgi:hypothetical protein
MKKFAMLCTVALLLSSVSIGCTSNGSSWCRTGSIFPTAKTKETTQVVYTAAAGSYQHCDPCEAAACNPCEPAACNPCEPVCNPCEPMCDPCMPYSRSGVITRGIMPGPAN